MEPEPEKLEEPEKPISKRRSSILKIAKVRNPFEEIETTETYTDFNSTKPVRRVSFASSNFIKPFVADPEKNTIWDTTYEEDVNHTNSTQSSQDHNTHSSTKLGSTFHESGPSLHNITMLSEQDMEYTNVLLLADKENIAHYPPQKKFSLVDYAKKLSTNSKDVVLDKTTVVSKSMELTCLALDKTSESVYDRQIGFSEVSLHSDVKGENSRINEMEFTCRIPLNNSIKTDEIPKGGKRLSTKCDKTTVESKSMELTCHTLNENSRINEMEFTCQIPLNSLVKTEEISKGAKKLSTKCDDVVVDKIYENEYDCETGFGEISLASDVVKAENTDNMEFTCHHPLNSLEKTNNTVTNRSQISRGNLTMDFTCLSGLPSTQINAMEFTCQTQPNLEITRVSESNLTKTAQTMELTCQSTEAHSTKIGDATEFCQPQQNDCTKNVTGELEYQVQNKSLRNHSIRLDSIDVNMPISSADVDTDLCWDDDNPHSCPKRPKFDFADISQNISINSKEAAAIAQMSIGNFMKRDDSSYSVSLQCLVNENTKTGIKTKSFEKNETLREKSCLAVDDNELIPGSIKNTSKNLELTDIAENVVLPNKSMETSRQNISHCGNKLYKKRSSEMLICFSPVAQTTVDQNLILKDSSNGSLAVNEIFVGKKDNECERSCQIPTDQVKESSGFNNTSKLRNSNTKEEKSCSAMEIDESFLDVENQPPVGVLNTPCQNAGDNSIRKPLIDVEVKSIPQNHSLVASEPVNVSQISDGNLTTQNKSYSICQDLLNIPVHNDTTVPLGDNVTKLNEIYPACQNLSNIDNNTRFDGKNDKSALSIPIPSDGDLTKLNGNCSFRQDSANILVGDNTTFDNKSTLWPPIPSQSMTFQKNVTLEEKSCSMMKVDQTYVNKSVMETTAAILNPELMATKFDNKNDNSTLPFHIPSQSMTVQKNVAVEEKSYSMMEVDQTYVNRSVMETKVGILTPFDNKNDNSTLPLHISSQSMTVQKNVAVEEKSYSMMEVDQTYGNKSIMETKATILNPNLITDDTRFDNKNDNSTLSLHIPSANKSQSMTVQKNVNVEEKSCSMMKVDQTFVNQSVMETTAAILNAHSILNYTRFDNRDDNSTLSLHIPSANKSHSMTVPKNVEEKSCPTIKIDQTYVKVEILNASNYSDQHLNVNRNLDNKLVKSPEQKLQHDQSNLELTSTIPVIKTQLPNLSTLKHELSALRTPEQSFHLNLTMSSGIDDTQQLLQCTYSKSQPVSFATPKFEDKDSSGFTCNLENTGHISRPTLTNISEYDLEENLEIGRREYKESPDISIFDIPRNSKLNNINDTYVLQHKKKSDESTLQTSYCDEDNSVGIIADDCLQTLGSEDQLITDDAIEELNKMADTSPTIKKVELKKVKLEIRRVSELSDLMERIQRQRAEIKNYLENFKFRPFRIPEELTIWECNKSRNNSDLLMESSDENCDSCPTMEDRIREHEKSCQKCWKLEMVDDDFYHFSTLFGTLVFVVRLDDESGKVINVQTTSKLKETAKPFAQYVMKLFLDRFDTQVVKSAIGNRFDMLSLLDYVKMTMLRLHRFQREFMLCHVLKMEEEFVAKFTICSVPLGIHCDVLVDVADVENLNFEKDLRIVSHIGVVNQNEVINLAKKSPKGLDFFQGFAKSIEEYFNHKEKKRLEK
ncbi:uncharacterized protein LOC135135082 isoform X1 [Zophobas morio]|uniref:uncharacterized protein LOC135135082 isoform X1 n=1 Tax=Zophobas morio TaxID=2755281 RepID=UPI0030829E37